MKFKDQRPSSPKPSPVEQFGRPQQPQQSAPAIPPPAAAPVEPVAPPAPAPSDVVEVAPEQPWITVSAGRIDLYRPRLWLQGSYYDGKDHVRECKPERAYIAHGVVVVEELGLWFPLASVNIGRKTP